MYNSWGKQVDSGDPSEEPVNVFLNHLDQKIKIIEKDVGQMKLKTIINRKPPKEVWNDSCLDSSQIVKREVIERLYIPHLGRAIWNSTTNGVLRPRQLR